MKKSLTNVKYGALIVLKVLNITFLKTNKKEVKVLSFWGAFLGSIAGIMILGVISAIYEAIKNGNNDNTNQG